MAFYQACNRIYASVHLEVARLTVSPIAFPNGLPLSNTIKVEIPDQFEIYRNTIDASTARVGNVFILNSVDQIKRVTCFFLSPDQDIGSNNLTDKNLLGKLPETPAITNFKLFINDRLVPRYDLEMPYYTTTKNDPPLVGPVPIDNPYQDVNDIYELYLKRCGNTLQNREDFNYQAMGTISYDTFRLYYLHYTINVDQREYRDPMMNISVQFTTHDSISDCTLYTIVEKDQQVNINIRGSNAQILTVG